MICAFCSRESNGAQIGNEADLENSDSNARTLAEALNNAERHHASLNARLSSYRNNSSRLRPDIAQAYDQLITRLGILDGGTAGPQIGERMLEFSLPDQNGKLTLLSDLLRLGPVVVSLNRGHWCPYCKLELRSIAANYDRIRQLGASVVSIMPDTAAFTSGYSEKNELPFSILTDMDLGYALALGLVFWVGSDVQKLYEDAEIELQQYQDNQSFFLPISAKFVVGQDGLVKARCVNVEFRERMEPAAIIAILETLSAR